MVPLYNKHRKYCIVVGCDSSYLDLFEGDDSHCKLRFHKFPFKYPRVLRKWKNVLSLKRVLQKNSLVCSKHFTIESYTSEAQKRLSRDAVPTLFIGYKVESLEEDVGQNLQCGPRTKKKILNKIHPQQKQGRKRKISSSHDSKSIAKDCKTDIQDYLKCYFGQLWDEAMISCPDGDESILLVVQPDDDDVASTTSNEVTSVEKRPSGTKI